MEKEFVPYELALELKELGFDEECFAFYNTTQMLIVSEFLWKNSFSKDSSIVAPLLQQAFRWFREKYPNIEFILPMKKKKDLGVFWGGGIKSEEMNFPKSYSSNFKTYEQAELECLKQLIKMAKNEPK